MAHGPFIPGMADMTTMHDLNLLVDCLSQSADQMTQHSGLVNALLFYLHLDTERLLDQQKYERVDKKEGARYATHYWLETKSIDVKNTVSSNKNFSMPSKKSLRSRSLLPENADRHGGGEFMIIDNTFSLIPLQNQQTYDYALHLEPGQAKEQKPYHYLAELFAHLGIQWSSLPTRSKDHNCLLLWARRAAPLMISCNGSPYVPIRNPEAASLDLFHWNWGTATQDDNMARLVIKLYIFNPATPFDQVSIKLVQYTTGLGYLDSLRKLHQVVQRGFWTRYRVL